MINYHLEFVGGDYPHASKNDLWAEPNIKHASDTMFNLATSREKKNKNGPIIDLSIKAHAERIIKRIKNINFKN